MAIVQDPGRQVSYLQQCLSSDKKPLGMFLGAGCPMSVHPSENAGEPLIPDIAGLTRIVCDRLGECEECGPLLRRVEGNFAQDGLAEATVEDILSHVRALRAVAGNDAVRGLTGSELDQLDERVCGIIHEVADKSLPVNRTPYHRVALWADAVQRDNPIEVFTTNYDLLMEQAFEDCRVPYFDGFAGVRRPFFDVRAMEEDMLPPRWARLWKLHGSINWYEGADKGVFRGTSNEGGGLRRVIHPSYLKYLESRRLPYLAMIDRLRAFMRKPGATLIVCGYSFRDEHINEVMVQGLECSQTAAAFALLYGGIYQYRQACQLAFSRSNLSVLCADGGVIGGIGVEWPKKDGDCPVNEDAEWVTWNPVDPSDPNRALRAVFNLGDFDVFGQFLAAIAGEVREMVEVTDAH